MKMILLNLQILVIAAVLMAIVASNKNKREGNSLSLKYFMSQRYSRFPQRQYHRSPQKNLPQEQSLQYHQ